MKVSTGGNASSPAPGRAAARAKPRADGDPPRSLAADDFGLVDADLDHQLAELCGDAATLASVPQAVDGLATIFGTARSRPGAGSNGHLDYLWNEALGAELRLAGYSVSTGAGPGNMEAPMAGHARMDAELDRQAGRSVGWEAGEPGTEGANIVLPHEQQANRFIRPERLKSFKRFLFRMEFLFRDNAEVETEPEQKAQLLGLERASRRALAVLDASRTPGQRALALRSLDRLAQAISAFIATYQPHNSPKIATPGGLGTVAEIFTYVAMKSHGQASEQVVYGSRDDFFARQNAAFAPLMYSRELPDLANVYTDPKALVRAVKLMPPTEHPIDAREVMPRMIADLERGLRQLDGTPKQVAIFGGEGPRTRAVQAVLEAIATRLSDDGRPLRVGGSPVADPAVLRGVAESSHPELPVQAFALDDAPVQSRATLDYTRVTDVLVLRELMDANLSGMVVCPEGATQLALLFTAACDMQTGKLPRVPIVVLDPDGRFEALMRELEALMLSAERSYLAREDLGLIRTAKTCDEAMALLSEPFDSPSEPVRTP